MSETHTPLKVHGNQRTGVPEAVDYLCLNFPTWEVGVGDAKWAAHTQTLEWANRITLCCNAHDGLVEALTEARDHLHTKQDMDRVRGLARAALASAGVKL